MKDLSRATRDAISIWSAGVGAVNGEQRVRSFVEKPRSWFVNSSGKIALIAAGKAALAMSAGLLAAIRDRTPCDLRRLVGQVHIPCDGTASSPKAELLRRYGVRVCEVRPPEVNLPTARVVQETHAARALVDSLEPGDFLVVLLSGGGSALLAEPKPPLTLKEKLDTIEFLVSRGADIEALNRVRGAISNVKLGRLTRHCRADQILTLALSDIIGDPPHLIAGGPTVASPDTAGMARQVIMNFDPECSGLPPRVRKMLFEMAGEEQGPPDTGQDGGGLSNYFVLANITSAVNAAASAASASGYQVRTEVVDSPENTGEAGRRLFRELCAMPAGSCLVSGGEPVMNLPAADKRGQGGRNQHLILTAMAEAIRISPPMKGEWSILSAGTDGQDGVTQAAGAWLDQDMMNRASAAGLDCRKALSGFDSATFLERCSSQLVTGPTETNVCDLRVVVKL